VEELRYPIGRFKAPPTIGTDVVHRWIDDIEALPIALRDVAGNLNAAQLETAYRPGGWTARQLVHHIADSHLNSIIRFKWALTEERPTIKPYYEDRWAELADYREVPIEASLNLIEALHARWVGFLRTLSHQDLQREFMHPDSGAVRLAENIGIYAWHGRHHLAHIRIAAQAA